MASLVRWNGKLLRKANGKLARGIECCCDYDPPEECPNCCIEITWGTFNGSGDLEELFAGMAITLVMPTKNSRIVCDGEQVTVRIEFTSLDLETVEGDHLPYVRWDRSWIYQSHTPAVTANGTVITDGLIEWRGLHFDVGGGAFTSIYEVVLTYDHCWGDYVQQWGDIEAGDRNGSFSLITGAFCEGSTDCCDEPVTCEPCCYYLAPSTGTDAYEFKASKAVFWAEAADGSQLKVEVDGLDPTKRTVCFTPGELGSIALNLDITYIPPEVDPGNPVAPEMGVSVGAWVIDAYTPGIGNGTEVLDPPPRSLTWGTDVTDREYAVDLSITCDKVVDGLPPIDVSTENPPMSIRIQLEECPNPQGFDCCCECPPCEFPDNNAINNVVWTCDDGNFAITFTQDNGVATDRDGCAFVVHGNWNVSDLQNGGDPVTYPGSISVEFDNGTWIFDGGVQSGVDFSLSCEGTCDGGQSCDNGCQISWTANGTECQPEGEP